MPQSTSFKGFPDGTLKFLCGVRANNTKKWFDANRSNYDEFYVAPAKTFVEAVDKELAKLAPAIVADPKINGSIFRINRDVRFSKDKRPYRDHLDFAFWEGEKKASASSFFFRVSPDGVFIGAGFHQGCPEHQKALRSAVSDADSGQALADLAEKLRKDGYELEGKHYKRIPRNTQSDGPATEFLLHNALYVVTEEKQKVACSPKLINVCTKHWKAALPLHRWLVDHVRG
jgi:uncharacterized protein (TIGR02453 family)